MGADSNAVSNRLSRAATTASPAGGKFTWVDRFVNAACNAGAGEKYLGASSKQVSDEKACKKSCEDTSACKSITFYSSGWCSHFSTECKARNTDSNAVSNRLSRAATTASPAGGKFTWAGMSKNTACDMGAGEKYLGASSKQVSDE